MKLNRRGKLLIVGVIASTLFGGTRLLANEMSPDMLYQTTKISSEISGKVLIPESSRYFTGLSEINIATMDEANQKAKSTSKYETTYVDLDNDIVLLSEGFLTGVEVGYDSYSYIGLTEQQGKLYLSYRTIDDEQLNHIYLDDSDIEIVSSDDMKEDDVYKCVGSLVGAVNKYNK